MTLPRPEADDGVAIVPPMLEVDFAHLAQEAVELETAGADRLPWHPDTQAVSEDKGGVDIREGILSGAGAPRRSVRDGPVAVRRGPTRRTLLSEIARATAEGAAGEDMVLHLVAGQARRLVGGAIATVVMPEPGGDAFVVRAAAGQAAEPLVGRRLSADWSIAAGVIRSGRPGRIADLAADPMTERRSAMAHVGVGPLLCVPLMGRGRPIGAIELGSPRGGRALTDEDQRAAEEFAAQAGVSIEYTRIREDLQRLATTVAVRGPLDETLHVLARTVVEATDMAACAVYLLESGHLRTAGTYGLPPGWGAAMDAADRLGARRPALNAAGFRSVVILADAVKRMLSDPLLEPAHALLRTVSWNTIASLPLVHHGEVLGAIAGYYPEGYRVRNPEVAFLKVIADEVAALVENARSVATAEATTALEERQRLARELHDSVSQALYGIALGAETAQNLLKRSPAKVAEPLDYVRKLAEAALAEMRALIFDLRPEALEKEGLVAALAKQGAAVEARHDIAVDKDLPDEPEAPLQLKEALFRIGQEALNNIAKHARATRVQLRLKSEDAALVLEIADDGVGFDTGQDFPGHLGLRSMRERALKLGGSLEVSATAGRGTRIRATLPVEPA